MKDDLEYILQPLTALLPLHRVNARFKAVLDTSPRLQRVMFMDYGRLSDDNQAERIDPNLALSDDAFDEAWEERPFRALIPLDFLLVVHLDIKTHFQLPTRLVIDVRKRGKSHLPARLEEFLRSSFGNTNASWRRTKVLQSETQAERLADVEVRFRRPKGYKGPNSYIEKFEYQDGTPLGVLFDEIFRLTSRRLTEHATAASAAQDTTG